MWYCRSCTHLPFIVLSIWYFGSYFGHNTARFKICKKKNKEKNVHMIAYNQIVSSSSHVTDDFDLLSLIPHVHVEYVFPECCGATRSAALTTARSRASALCACCRCTTTGSPASLREPFPPCIPCPPCESHLTTLRPPFRAHFSVRSGFLCRGCCNAISSCRSLNLTQSLFFDFLSLCLYPLILR